MRVQILQSPRTRNQDTLIADGFEGVSCKTVLVNGKWENVLYIHVGGVGSREGHSFKVKLPSSALVEVRAAIADSYAGVLVIDDYRHTHFVDGSDERYTRCGLRISAALKTVERGADCERCNRRR